MPNRILAVNGALLSFFLAACAPASYNAYPARDPDLITFDQLEDVRGQSAFEAIRKVRPNFLYSRGPTMLIGTTGTYATVYVDGVRYGSIETLRTMPASWIGEVRLYRVPSPGNMNPREFGGVIAIKTRRH